MSRTIIDKGNEFTSCERKQHIDNIGCSYNNQEHSEQSHRSLANTKKYGETPPCILESSMPELPLKWFKLEAVVNGIEGLHNVILRENCNQYSKETDKSDMKFYIGRNTEGVFRVMNVNETVNQEEPRRDLRDDYEHGKEQSRG